MPLLKGGIVIWSGSTLDIPNGWALCDGTNSTLDLRNRFIIGAGDLYTVGETGGSADAILVEHSHAGTTNSFSHSHTIPGPGGGGGTGASAGNGGGSLNPTSSESGSHSHTLTIDNEGVDPTDKNLPPYFALCYIQQL